MASNAKVTNPKRYITEYYDSLINHVDILAEEALAKHDEQQQLDLNDKRVFKLTSGYLADNDFEDRSLDQVSFGDTAVDVSSYQKTYEIASSHPNHRLDKCTSTVSVHKYVNEMREEMIDELRKLQNETLRNYEASVRSSDDQDENEMARLKRKIFDRKFAFLVCSLELRHKWTHRELVHNSSPLNVYLVVLDDFFLDDQNKILLG